MPPATASPAEAAVWTKLFSQILDPLKKRKIPMDKMAAGIEAEVKIPNFKAKKALAVANKMVNNTAIKMTLNVNSIFGEAFFLILNHAKTKMLFYLTSYDASANF